MSIASLIKDKSDKEKFNIKAIEIAKINHVGKFTNEKHGIDVEIVSLNSIENGIEIFARAWKDGQQIGFGIDGTTDLERFRIFNPPILVTDPNGDIVRERIDDITGEKKQWKFREDPQEAIRQTLAHTIIVSGKPGKNIVIGSIGNTTDTFFPGTGSGGTTCDAVMSLSGNTDFAATRSTTTASNVDNSTAQNGAFRCIISGGNYFIQRSIYTFDTSIIGTDTINSATFSVMEALNKNAGTRSVAVVLPAPASAGTIATTDFDAAGKSRSSLNSPTEGATRTTQAQWVTNSYTDMALNATGLTWVIGSGVTKLGLNDAANDIDNSAPGDDCQWDCFFADQTGTSSDPKLVVVHTANAKANPHMLSSTGVGA